MLEHIPPAECVQAIENLSRVTDCILFSSTPSDVTEATHFNVRPLISWLRSFAEAGFHPDTGYDGGFLTPHAMLLRRGEAVSPSEQLAYSRLLMAKCQLSANTKALEKLGAQLQKDQVQLEELRSAKCELEKLRSRHDELIISHQQAVARTGEAERIYSELQGRVGELAIRLAKADLEIPAFLQAQQRLEESAAVLRTQYTDERNRSLSLEKALSQTRDEARAWREKTQAGLAERTGLLQRERQLLESAAALQRTNEALSEAIGRKRSEVDRLGVDLRGTEDALKETSAQGQKLQARLDKSLSERVRDKRESQEWRTLLANARRQRELERSEFLHLLQKG